MSIQVIKKNILNVPCANFAHPITNVLTETKHAQHTGSTKKCNQYFCRVTVHFIKVLN